MSDFSHLIGRPYKLGARGPKEYDCWGVVREISAALGRPLPDYDREEFSRVELIRLIRGETHIADPIDSPVDGAIAWVASGHVGIFIDGRVYSAERNLGVTAKSVSVWIRNYTTRWFMPRETES